MLLPINSEKNDIFLQIRTIEKMRAKLSHQVAHIKEFAHLRLLFKFIENHLTELESTDEGVESRNKAELYLAANTRIKNHMCKKLQQLQLMTMEYRYESYASCATECLRKIIAALASIEWKLLEVGHMQRESSLAQKGEILIIELNH